jgi:hydroxymethylpyrimidine/phosphomethylpyrimidine kinase
LFPNLTELFTLIQYLKFTFVEVYIIWDPILKASAGFNFHQKDSKEKIFPILSLVDLATPNYTEALAIFGEDFKQQDYPCNIIVKGTPAAGNMVEDFLWLKNGITIKNKYPILLNAEKHGTGCIYSSVIASKLSKNATLEESFIEAGNYVQRILKSSSGILGIHSQS